MALAPFGVPRLDSGMLMDDFFGGLGGMMSPWGGRAPSGQVGSLALATRPLYVDVSEEKDKYVMTVDVPGARRVPRARVACWQNLNGGARRIGAVSGTPDATPPARRASRAGVKKENINLEAEGNILRVRRAPARHRRRLGLARVPSTDASRPLQRERRAAAAGRGA